MKFNKIITVLMLCGICSAAQHTVTAHAATDDTVISNQVTFENDTVEVTTGSAVTAGAVVVSNATVAANGVSAISISENTSNAATVTEESSTVIDTTNEVSDSTQIGAEVVETDSEAVLQEKETVSIKLSSKQTKTKKKYTASELKLMSCIIYCEAVGEPYAGKKAVGIVIMNRKSSKSFPNTLKGVIYQKYQFGPTRNGSLKKALKKYEAGQFKSTAEKACIRAAKSALNGDKKVTYKSKTHNMKSYYYFSTRVSGARLTIKNHQFK